MFKKQKRLASSITLWFQFTLGIEKSPRSRTVISKEVRLRNLLRKMMENY